MWKILQDKDSPLSSVDRVWLQDEYTSDGCSLATPVEQAKYEAAPPQLGIYYGEIMTAVLVCL